MADQAQQDYGIRRFVVLHHTGGEADPHFDFLFDTTDTSSLITFRLREWPLRGPKFVHPAIRLRDHRRLYLAYEGSLTGDRGRVDRVDEGAVHVIESASGWLLKHPDGEPFLLFEPADAAQADAAEEWRVEVLQPHRAG